MIRTKIEECEENIMKKRLFTIMLGLTLICTGCGSNKSSDEAVKQSYVSDTSAPAVTESSMDMEGDRKSVV